MAAVERTLTINVRNQVIKVPAYRRAKKAVTAVREFLQRHMKSDNVKLGKYLNLKLWEHGIKNPAMRITVIAKKDDKGIVTAELPNIPQTKKQKQVQAQKAAAKKSGKAKAPVAAPAALPAKAAEKTAAVEGAATTPAQAQK